MNATKPGSVPDNATLLHPDQSFPPGAGVQTATLKSIFSVNASINARNDLFYRRALADWTANKAQYEAYNQRVPPEPFKPPVIVDKVVYSNQDGTVVDPPEGADGLHCAWVWEVYE